ncbi:MAG: shikimate kinase [Verrucomicrobia bacterium]|nr:shikimate kinase [Verrucomicrobiota bacterium]
MSDTRAMHNLALIGFMGTGKSTVGRFLARQLDYAFVDTDELIETRAKKTISAIFAEDGEPAFRVHERQVVEELGKLRRTIIATGGGLGANPANLARLREHAFIVCLWASPEYIWQRVRHQTHRPLLQDTDPLARIKKLLAERRDVYHEADVLLNTERRSVREVAQIVIHQFNLARAAGG